MVIIRDTFDPDNHPEPIKLEDLPDQDIKRLVMSGSHEAAQILARRRSKEDRR